MVAGVISTPDGSMMFNGFQWSEGQGSTALNMNDIFKGQESLGTVPMIRVPFFILHPLLEQDVGFSASRLTTAR